MSVIDLQPYLDKARRKDVERLSRALRAAINDCLLQMLREAERRSKTTASETNAKGAKWASHCKGFDDNTAEHVDRRQNDISCSSRDLI